MQDKRTRGPELLRAAFDHPDIGAMIMGLQGES
jgi:hypothetical protein